MEDALLVRLGKIADRMENILDKHSGPKLQEKSLGPPENALPRPEDLLDGFLGDKLEEFLKRSAAQGGIFEKLGKMIFNLFAEERKFLSFAAGCETPKHLLECEFLKPVLDICEELELWQTEKFPKDDYVAAIAVGAKALPICAIDSRPDYLQISTEAKLDEMMFYMNRAFKKYKEENYQLFEMALLAKTLFFSFSDLIGTHYKDKSIWNTHPEVHAEKKEIPIPPPPPPVLRSAPAPTGIDALMADLNTGLSATGRLKKVGKKKTIWPRKLPTEKKTLVETSKIEEGKITWNGQRWLVENLKEDRNAKLDVPEMKMPVYIYNCQKSNLTITGKANSIIIDNCKDFSVTCAGLVSSCEVINSSSVEVQSFGELPTLSIQGTRGCHLFLPKEHSNTQIVSCSSTNMLVTVKYEENEVEEMTIPEQFVTRIDKKKLVTNPLDIA